jgi:AAA+ ATPase superfamily predicted ATPase
MIGRKEEKQILTKAFASNKPELVAVIGRRRVGKTYLIRSFFRDKLDFEVIGLKDNNRKAQLKNFAFSLKQFGKKNALEDIPKDWLDAFHQLKEHLESLKEPQRKKVIFIDELPWMYTPKSDFLTGFGYFWNSYASDNNVLVVICGSATAWMIKNIINNRGGLHNRVTKKILLRPFTLSETKEYFLQRNIIFNHYQLLLLYMTMGGIPQYLDQVEGGKSAVQNIDNICFSQLGSLRTEFDNLYSSLFAKPEKYEAIVTALATKWKGLSRVEIVKLTKINDGGGLTTRLKELEQSGFITSYIPFNKKKKDTLYRLTDNYSLFYLKFIQNTPPNDAGQWTLINQTQSWKSWSGYAFENICLQHIKQIKTALGISGIHTQQFSFLSKSTDDFSGIQIDLLIDRNDNTISMCEIKFYNDHFIVSKKESESWRRKKTIFKELTRTKKQIFITLITTYGLTENVNSLGLIDNVVDMDALFAS